MILNPTVSTSMR